MTTLSQLRGEGIALVVVSLALAALVALSATMLWGANASCCPDVAEPIGDAASAKRAAEILCEHGAQMTVGPSPTWISPSPRVHVAIDDDAESGDCAGFRRRIERPPNDRA